MRRVLARLQVQILTIISQLRPELVGGRVPGRLPLVIMPNNLQDLARSVFAVAHDRDRDRVAPRWALKQSGLA
jgi:hypothetical protein